MRVSTRLLLIAAVLMTASLLPPTSSASAASFRLHVLTFNACDQFQAQNGAPQDCKEDDRPYRAERIAAYIESSPGADVVALQEICMSTLPLIESYLPPNWSSYGFRTVFLDDNRCGANNSWGLAIMSRSHMSFIVYEQLTDDPASSENRWILCGNITQVVGYRFCSTHLEATNKTLTSRQIQDVADYADSWVDSGAAILIMGDFNANVRSCNISNPPSEVRKLGVMYLRTYYGPGNFCNTASGEFFELDADYPRTNGDGSYDERTRDGTSSGKIDFIFANPGRFGESLSGAAPADSAVSDHRVLRGSVTVYD